MRIASIFFILIATLFSCKSGDDIPANIIPEPKMRQVLWDVIRAGQYLNVFVVNRDTSLAASENQRYYAKVFQLHKVTKKQFDDSYQYYREHPELMKRIMDSLVKLPPVVSEAPTAPVDSLREKNRMEGKGRLTPDSIRRRGMLKPFKVKA